MYGPSADSCDCKPPTFGFDPKTGSVYVITEAEECFRCAVRRVNKERQRRHSRIFFVVAQTLNAVTALVLLWNIGFNAGWW